MSDAFADAMEQRRVQIEEYSQYVATGVVTNSMGTVIYGGAGAAIPASNVNPDGSIILYRHICPGIDPETGEECPIEHNKVLEVSGPGMARKVTAPKKSAAAKDVK